MASTATRIAAACALVPSCSPSVWTRSAGPLASTRVAAAHASTSASPSADMPIRLVIADDHTVVLKGLATFLGLEPDLEILATCTNGDDAVEAVRRHRPDILLLDLRMPVVDGLAVLRTLSTHADPPRV